MPNGSYQGAQTTRSADAQQRRHVGRGHRADQPDPVGDAEPLGQPAQPDRLRVVGQLARRPGRRR